MIILNIIYELDRITYIFLIIILSVIFVFFVFVFCLLISVSLKLKSKLMIIFDLAIAFGMVSLFILDTKYILFLYKMEHQQYNKLCGTISIVSMEESYSKYQNEPDYKCTVKIGDEIVSDIGYFPSDIIDKFNENPKVEFYYGTVSGENLVWKIVEVQE